MKSSLTIIASSWVLVLVLVALSVLPTGSQAASPAVQAPVAGRGNSIGATGWSSGWVPLTPNNPVTLQHALGGDLLQYAVQMWFKDTDGGFGINTRAYGGLEVNGVYYGAFWENLTESGIEVTRSSGDNLADEVRVWIWIPDDPPEYCSPWTDVPSGGSQVITHNLGGNVDDYVVGLWFQSPNVAYGINQHAYGGMEAVGANWGAWWNKLTDSTVQVQRAAQDPYANSVRVCISLADPTAYDSGWVDVAQGETLTLDHDVGGDLDRYVVRMEFKDAAPGGSGIHHENAGGNAIGSTYVGTNWENLTTSTIDVFRRPQDETTDKVRVRIWLRQTQVYLPLILRSQ